MSSSEAAAVLGIRAGTVRSRLHRIRKELDTVRFAAPAANDQKGDRT
ncbi:sigma factor-like helix-turn-helix DNA-binding protein [Ilumatobacter sp.]